MSGEHILVIDDEPDIRSLIREILSDEGYEVRVAADASEARTARQESKPDLILLDVWMPDTDGITLLKEWTQQPNLRQCPVVIMSGHGTVDTAVEATRLGAFDYIEKPLSLSKLLHTVERALESGRKNAPQQMRRMLSPLAPVGKSEAMRDLREQARKLAGHDTPVLVIGEPGSGREAFARYMHGAGPRADSEYVSITGGALTDENAETQLFGMESGGEIHEGLLDQAVGGTLFVNELGDASPTAQKLLASALEQGSYLRRGGTQPVLLDVRVMASLPADYEQLLEEGRLRRDLFAHLSVLTLRVPPLREYAEDVPELLRYYAEKLVDSEGLPFRRFGVAAQNRLRNYPWPDNVRELKNLVHRVLINGDDEEVTLAEIEQELKGEAPEDEPLVKQDLLALPLREAREAFERAYLTQQLILCNGKVGKLAQRVGMERTHLYRKLRALGVDFRQTGSAADD
ncbi:MAG: sigma-54 dependent transcriptional regulator [Gammaproteobacteria bacterium]